MKTNHHKQNLTAKEKSTNAVKNSKIHPVYTEIITFITNNKNKLQDWEKKLEFVTQNALIHANSIAISTFTHEATEIIESLTGLQIDAWINNQSNYIIEDTFGLLIDIWKNPKTKGNEIIVLGKAINTTHTFNEKIHYLHQYIAQYNNGIPMDLLDFKPIINKTLVCKILQILKENPSFDFNIEKFNQDLIEKYPNLIKMKHFNTSLQHAISHYTMSHLM